MAKTAREHLATKKNIKKVVLTQAFAGAKQGQTMLVATPSLVDDYIKKIPYGHACSIQNLRKELAQKNGCDVTCPVSTSIFIRISAQAAMDEMQAGVGIKDITPFWRVLKSQEKIAKKLTIDGQWIDNQRIAEGLAIT